MRNHTSSIAIAISGVFAISFMAYSAGPGAPQRLIPYHGYLEDGSAPLTGNRTLTFHLYDDADAASTSINYSEDHSVDIVAGRFSVLIGSTNVVPAAAFVARDLFVGVDVDGVALNGLSRVAAVPQAVRSGVAEDLDVTDRIDATRVFTSGRISAGGSADVGGTFGVDGASVFNDAVRIQQAGEDNSGIAAGRALLVTGDTGDGNSDNAIFEVRQNNQNQGIGIGSNTIYATGSNANQLLRLKSRGTDDLYLNVGDGGAVRIGNDLDVDDAITVGGALTAEAGADVTGLLDVSGNATVSGTIRSSCPTNATFIAGYCVENTIRPARVWETAAGAVVDCNNRGGQVCPISVLLACDIIEPAGAGCSSSTDNNVWHWTSGSQGNDVDAFSNVIVFNHSGNDATNEIDHNDGENNSRQYYCCLPAGLQ